VINPPADAREASPGRRTLGWAAAAAATLLVLGGCTSEPLATIEAAPTLPAGWITTTSDTLDLRLTLPDWLGVFESSGAVFANEVRPAGEQGLQLLAEGPRTAMLQPKAGEDRRLWLERKVGAPGQGQPAFRSIRLPSGPALVLGRVDRAGTPTAWRIMAYAIETDFGVAFLLIDGPHDMWAGREDDVLLIPHLVEVAPGAGP